MTSTDGQEGHGSAAGLRILVVEDEMLVAMLMEDMLMDLGYEVVGTASRINTAVEMAQRETFDAAILDVNLNGQEAYPVADVLIARGIPFAFATGYGETGVREPYRSHPTLQKPFQQQHLKDVIAKVLGLKAG
ncbi:response regulator [Rhodospirillaceae bacterium SYSU D60014]|uniref:response regulator n=1 Tax=Virgifigura deserti TaxID=2268457 RepID=UPI000E660978